MVASQTGHHKTPASNAAVVTSRDSREAHTEGQRAGDLGSPGIETGSVCEGEKAMAPHSSTLAWKTPWMEERGALQSMGWLGVGHDFTFTFHFHALEKEMATSSSVLAWRIPGMGEPDGLPSMGSHRVGHNWSDLAAAAAVCEEHPPKLSELPFAQVLLNPEDQKPIFILPHILGTFTSMMRWHSN